ncbi:hypothetical protein Pla175_44730 [Pirellulimonas nuda]|uniref:Uncharacterized protein n=1 Tax=Pirellulimonas nuda TaxID=2528009 RepID=A0A518DHW1_9BACT|nr:hypothetical protein [Pirellulimonas nuda]QDU91056.1 hypothetical protein Pla175_44730 [Pirellulimonas nuda]
MTTFHDKLVRWVTECGDMEFYADDSPLRSHEAAWDPQRGPALYATKRVSLMSRREHQASESPVAVLGSYGLPTGQRRQWLRSAFGEGKVCFFGDLDGPDLVAFASLVDGMPDPAKLYLGISDALLSEFSVPLDSLDWCLIPTTVGEQKAIAMLEGLGFPVRDIVGSECYCIIQAGQKVEIEGLLWEIPADDLLAFVANRSR